MLISLCTPIMNRLHDLMRAIPFRMDAINASPPVEMVILDYNSTDGLRQYVETIMRLPLADGNSIVYKRYTGRDSYHMAHAYNLSILASSGEYFWLMGADTYPTKPAIAFVRQAIQDNPHITWMEGERYKGAIVCRKDAFVAAGGYDERFELYGPEDRELALRLTRRGGHKEIIPKDMIGLFRTPDDEKVKNFRVKGSKKELSAMMRKYYDESLNNFTLRANPGGWGQW